MVERGEENERKVIPQGKAVVEYTGPKPNVFVGGAIGGGLGAVIGFLIGGSKVAAIAGGLGAAIGGGLAASAEEKDRS